MQADEWLVAFDEWGIVTARYDTVTGTPIARRIGRGGSTEGESEGVLPLVFSSTGIGLAATGTDGSGLINHQLVGATFRVLADVGKYHAPLWTSAWSPSGDHVALVDYRSEDALDFHLEVWSATGEMELDLPLRHFISGVDWTVDGRSIVLQATDNARWQGFLIVDLETKAMSKSEVDRETLIAIAAGAS